MEQTAGGPVMDGHIQEELPLEAARPWHHFC